jgi:hypothetical protein
MGLQLSDFAEVIECKLKKIATVGHDRQDMYFCSNCKAMAFAKRSSPKPLCKVAEAMNPPPRNPRQP